MKEATKWQMSHLLAADGAHTVLNVSESICRRRQPGRTRSISTGDDPLHSAK